MALGNLSSAATLHNKPTGKTLKQDDWLPVPQGYTRIWVEIESKVPKGKDGKVALADDDIERAILKKFGLSVDTDADLAKTKQKLGTTDNPFDYLKGKRGSPVSYQASGKYKVPVDLENSLYEKLSGKAAKVKKQTEAEKNTQNSGNLGDNVASKENFDRAKYERQKLDKLIREAEILPSNFGIPSKLYDMTHVVVSLTSGAAVNEDSALAALIEKKIGGTNIFGQDKINILNAAKQAGVKIENLKVSPNNSRVVEFDINLESLLKLQKACIDVQDKVNGDIAVFDKISREMAVSQFILGVVTGAYEDIKGNVNTILHPLETIQAIRDAVGILLQLSVEDIKNIAAELGKNAPNLTLGQVAYGAGYAVGTAVVELILAKGFGAALSILGKTKAGAAFLAKFGKGAEILADIAKSGKAKLAELFSDEAASLAAKRLLNGNKLYAVLPGAPLPPEVITDFGVIIGNKVGKEVTSFRQIVKDMSAELGDAVKPHLNKLAESYREMMKKAGLKADENEIISIFEEWKVERAKNINDSMNISDVSEITSKGYVDRQELRRKIGQADYPDYEPKHIKGKSNEDARRMSMTGNRPPAQFLPGLKDKLKGTYQQAIENAMSNGLFKKEGGKWVFIHRFEETIGYDKGKATNWIKVELTDNAKPDIHGHPIDLQEVRRLFPEVKGGK